MPKRPQTDAATRSLKRQNAFYGAANFSKQRQMAQMAVKRQLKYEAERKELPTYATTAAVSNTGSVICVNEIAEGTDYNNRIGRRIEHLNCVVDYSIANSTTQDTGFIALVLDRQPNTVLPSFANIFDTQSAAINAGSAFKNTQQSDRRFKIIWVDQWAVSTVGSENVKVRKYTDLCLSTKGDEVVEFVGSGAAVPNTGGLYLCWGGQVNTSTITYNVKLKYRDL